MKRSPILNVGLPWLRDLSDATFRFSDIDPTMTNIGAADYWVNTTTGGLFIRADAGGRDGWFPLAPSSRLGQSVVAEACHREPDLTEVFQ